MSFVIRQDDAISSTFPSTQSLPLVHQNPQSIDYRRAEFPPPIKLATELRPESILPLTLVFALLLLRLLLASSGPKLCSPLALAIRFNTSVRLITPINRPLVNCPGRLAAVTALPGTVKGGPCVGLPPTAETGACA